MPSTSQTHTPSFLTTQWIKKNTSTEAYRDGRQVYRDETMDDVVLRGDVLTGDVDCGLAEPFRVTIRLADTGVKSAECDYPYKREMWCGHIVAVLLICAERPDCVEFASDVAAALAPLSRNDLQAILMKLSFDYPHLADEIATDARQRDIEARVAGSLSEDGSVDDVPSPASSADAAEVRKRLQVAVRDVSRHRRYRDYDRYGYDDEFEPNPVLDAMAEVLEEAKQYLLADDGRGALTVVEVVTEEYVAEWNEMDDRDDGAFEFFVELGEVWTEALLAADLSHNERARYKKVFDGWRLVLKDHGINPFEASLAALESGWDDPGLLKPGTWPPKAALVERERDRADHQAMDDVVARRIHDDADADNDAMDDGDEEDFDGESGYVAVNGIDFDADDDAEYAYERREIVEARVRILRRRKRWDDLLNYATKAGRDVDVVATLIVLGRIEEAESVTVDRLSMAEQAYWAAQQFEVAGAEAAARRIAAHGLNLKAPRYPLAEWLYDRALAHGEHAAAQHAAYVMLKEQIDLANWQRAQIAAGEAWSSWRAEVLAAIEATRFTDSGHIDILLQEGMTREALERVQASYNYDLVARVVDAVYEQYPQESIDICRKQAEPIMDGGKAKYYHHAGKWLERAKRAYLFAGMEAEWRDYHQNLIRQHGRKYRLMEYICNL